MSWGDIKNNFGGIIFVSLLFPIMFLLTYFSGALIVWDWYWLGEDLSLMARTFLALFLLSIIVLSAMAGLGELEE